MALDIFLSFIYSSIYFSMINKFFYLFIFLNFCIHLFVLFTYFTFKFLTVSTEIILVCIFGCFCIRTRRFYGLKVPLVLFSHLVPSFGPDRQQIYPSSSPAFTFSLAKKAMCGNRRSWCVVKTRQANRLGSHMWFRKRLMLP